MAQEKKGNGKIIGIILIILAVLIAAGVICFAIFSAPKLDGYEVTNLGVSSDDGSWVSYLTGEIKNTKHEMCDSTSIELKFVKDGVEENESVLITDDIMKDEVYHLHEMIYGQYTGYKITLKSIECYE